MVVYRDRGLNTASFEGLYGDNTSNLYNTLCKMVDEAYKKSDCDKTKMYGVVRSWVEKDQRFAHFDRDRLVQELQEKGKTCTKLDLDDPYLRGGPRRPLSR